MTSFTAAAKPLQLDHLVVLAATLEAGTQHVAEPQAALLRLRGFHAQAPALQAELDWLGARHLLTLDATLVEPSLIAEFDTPQGVRVLK